MFDGNMTLKAPDGLRMSRKDVKLSTDVKIQNVVASASLKHELDIRAIFKAFPHAEYKPETFPGLVFRLKRPKTATLIFASGKMICAGGKSEKEAIRAVKKIVKMLKKEDIIIRGKPEIEIQNIVASARLGGRVDLVTFYMQSGDEKGGGVMYEPEQFPGLIYRMEEPKAVILVFASGKLVCTGTKKEADVYQAVEKIRQKLEKYETIFYNEPRETVIEGMKLESISHSR